MGQCGASAARKGPFGPGGRMRKIRRESDGDSLRVRKLFGTDGIRAVAGEAQLDGRTIFAVGTALGKKLSVEGKETRVVLGMDTRESGPWIAATLIAGLRSAGAQTTFAGILTTPAVAYLARKHGFAAGIVISASHNPWQDNGIKIFGGDGYKLPDAVELAMEALIEAELAANPREHVEPVDPAALPDVDEGLRTEYVQFLRNAFPGLSLDNRCVVIDCANGAASALAPQLFADLHATVEVTHASPDGRNINAPPRR